MDIIPYKFVVLDFETTGSDSSDRIIQIGAAIVEEGAITRKFATFVNPGVAIPPIITRITGITDADVEDAPGLDEAMMEMLPLLDGAILVAHNAMFDLGFLQRALVECGYEPFAGKVLDTLEFLRFLYPELSGLALNRACAALGIPLEQHHRADNDAHATAMLWLNCMERLDQLSLMTLRRLIAVFGVSPAYEDVVWLLEDIALRKEQSDTSYVEDPSSYRQFRIGTGEWNTEEGRAEPVDHEWFQGGFDAFYENFKQSLVEQLPQYEERPAQEQMIHDVYRALEDRKHLMIEAGTGTGKSLGYLIPALYYSLVNDEKVVVSTHTINLQEQIRSRDIPLLQQLFPVPVHTALLKGRNHYLCLRKFEQKINSLDFEFPKEDPLTAAQMITWLETTEHGDEEELHFGIKGKDFWRTVESDTDSCLNRACPWFRRCFYHGARHKANIADVVVTNHSLLFTDVKAEHRLLPSYQHLVIDEAHQFEETAGKHLGIEVSYFSAIKNMQRLYKDSYTGLIPLLAFRLKENNQEGAWDKMVKAIDDTMPELVSAREQWDRLAELLYGMLESRNGEQGQAEGQYVLRIHGDALPASWREVRELEADMHARMTKVATTLDRCLIELKDQQEELDIQGLTTDLSGALKDIVRFRDGLRFIIACGEEDYVYWLEGTAHYRNRSLHMSAVPIDVAPKLQEYFFDSKESIILTSATLSVDKSFDYACRQLGLTSALESGKLLTVLLPSVFNFREQALVCIPRDFPSVRGKDDIHFVTALAQSLTDVALRMDGRMMVLFTSYKMLKQTYEQMKDPLESHGVTLLGQGMDSSSRSKLVRMFQEQSSTVLLGTSSFWEGVDIPGQALTCLAIVRLPFQPPNHPLVEAKNDAIKRENQNPFMKLSVPAAVIRFKQGFGRLVRTAQDKGIVLIYDTRVIDTAYGKYFLYSLPGPKIEHLPTERLVARIGEWLEQEGSA